MPSISKPHDDEGEGSTVPIDTQSIDALYERYLRNAPISNGSIAGESSAGLDDLAEITDLSQLRLECAIPAAQSQSAAPDASATLFIEGLPASCTAREVSHIFRPYRGYKEVCVVKVELRHPGGDIFVLGFVDFETPANAAVARAALQGYVFDVRDPDSRLTLHFSHSP